ncbi:hypothetical protein ER308_20660 [Egibacter rhizosphaerae]|uniref:Uncharacterized protein n=1 Tax=Egibacter rhizosphaerae TaxID=1670831 RepID=A0A411YKI8_9ACTN|nr:hypothetical protein [Egibacter rhizosphaerae]QBI21734.1 hypothetical protein ER308_20660 [Egibacter rhizosphaerae]
MGGEAFSDDAAASGGTGDGVSFVALVRDHPWLFIAWLALFVAAAVLVQTGTNLAALAAMAAGIVVGLLMPRWLPTPRWVLVALFAIFPPIALIMVPVSFIYFHRRALK